MSRFDEDSLTKKYEMTRGHLRFISSTRVVNGRDAAAVPFSHMINLHLFEEVCALRHAAEW